MEDKALTICSVYHSSLTKKLLELNFELTRKLNGGAEFIWLVADNTPSGLGDKISHEIFFVVPGVLEMPSAPRPWMKGSYHHAAAINKSLGHIKTRFAVILDADFFILQKEWIKNATKHMQKQNLAFFGAPYHPGRFAEYRYFPSGHCLFIDLEKINIKDLDFMPDYEDVLQKRLFLPRAGKRLSKIFLRKRSRIGTSRDTGYKVYKKFSTGNAKYETVQPIFNVGKFLFYEKLLPDFLSFFPKKTGYFVSDFFRDRGFYDADKNSWEEYVWLNKPFGIHLHNDTELKNNPTERLNILRDALRHFF